MHVERLERCAVHLRVLLGRGEQPRDAPDGVGDLVEQAVGLQGPHRVGQADLEVRRRHHLSRSVSSQLRSTPAATSVDAMSTSAGDAVVLEPVGATLPHDRTPPAATGSGRPGAIEGASRQVGDRFELVGGELATDEVHRPSPASRPACLAAVALARSTAATGLLSSCVRPAVTEPSATRRSCRATVSVAAAALDLESRQQVGGHREPLPHRAAEVGRGQLEQPAVGDGPRRCPGTAAERRGRPGARRTRRCTSRSSRSGTARSRRPGRGSTSRCVPESNTKKHEAGAPSAWIVAPAGYSTTRPRSASQPSCSSLRCSNRNRVRSCSGGNRSGSAHWCSRYVCRSWIAMAPSPTADATRLIELARTSPAANTPGTLASR